MILFIDNYDSFTYNIVQYLGDLGAETQVYRNDKISVKEAFALNPKGILISPGPGTPDQSGICLDLIKEAGTRNTPLLGICLGHQAIGQVFGGKVIRAPKPVHGKTAQIHHKEKSVFQTLPSPFEATRYHSLIIEKDSLPPELEITAETEDGIIMGIVHKEKPLHGVQFHPESIATEHGHTLLENFLKEI